MWPVGGVLSAGRCWASSCSPRRRWCRPSAMTRSPHPGPAGRQARSHAGQACDRRGRRLRAGRPGSRPPVGLHGPGRPDRACSPARSSSSRRTAGSSWPRSAGTIKVFDSLSDTTPTTFADLQHAGRRLLGPRPAGHGAAADLPRPTPTSTSCTRTTRRSAARRPRWNDACPTPPGPTTDGCVVSGRLSRLQASGNVSTGPEQVLINDWCQQYPSHSIGTVAFGPDGALYVSGGDGASFNFADYGQAGGSRGQPDAGQPVRRSRRRGRRPAQPGPADDADGGGGSGSYARHGPRRWPGRRTGGSARRAGTTAVDAGRGAPPGTYVGGVDARRRPARRRRRATRRSTLNGRPATSASRDAASLDVGDAVHARGLGQADTLGDAIDKHRRQGWTGAYWPSADPTTTGTSWPHGKASRSSATRRRLPARSGCGITSSWTQERRDRSPLHRTASDVTAPSPNSTSATPPSDLHDRRRSGANDRVHDGTIDEVAIYNNGAVRAPRSPPTTPPRTAARRRRPTRRPSTGRSCASTPPPAPRWPATRTSRRRTPTRGGSSRNGYRNPFRFTFRPTTSELWIGDVGWNTWEEIDLDREPHRRRREPRLAVLRGQRPPVVVRQPQPRRSARACTRRRRGRPPRPTSRYNHGSTIAGETCPTANGSSIAGLAFYTGGSYPASYQRRPVLRGLHRATASGSCRRGPTAGRTRAQVAKFIEGAVNPVYLAIGPGGDLFYADFDGGTIHRITFASGNLPPTAVASATPTSGAAPLTVQFTGSGSTDPEGGPLTYAWDFDGNGTDDDVDRQPELHLHHARDLRRAPAGHGQRRPLGHRTRSRSASTTRRPSRRSSSPSPTLTWAVGDPIAFSGGADRRRGRRARREPAVVDASSSTTARSTPTTATRTTSQTISGVASGSFAAPDHDYPSYLELVLTATDSGGLTGTTSVRLDPKTAHAVVRHGPDRPPAVGWRDDLDGAVPADGHPGLAQHAHRAGPADRRRDDLQLAVAGRTAARDRTTSSRRRTRATPPPTWPFRRRPTSASRRPAQLTGSQVRITAVVTNGGPGSASAVTLTDVLNTKLIFVSATSTVGTCAYASGSRTVTCTIGTLANGAQATVTILASDNGKGNVANIVTVSSTTPDPEHRQQHRDHEHQAPLIRRGRAR